MTVLKVFSYTWLTTLPSTHVTRSSEAVLVKYNYSYFFPRPNKHIQGCCKGKSSLPPTPEWHTQRDGDMSESMQADVAEWESQIQACGPRPWSSSNSSWSEWKPSKSPDATVARPSAEAKQELEHPEEGIGRSDRWPSSVPSTASDPGTLALLPPPQPKPSQAPYVTFADMPGLEQVRAEAEDCFRKACDKQGHRTLADLRGHFSQLNLAAGCQSEPGTARSRSGSVDSADSSKVTSCGSKKSKSRAERDRGPKRKAVKNARAKAHLIKMGGTWSDHHRAERAALALAESGSFKGTVAKANYTAHINETNDNYVDEGADARVEDALIKEAGLIISRFDTKRQV